MNRRQILKMTGGTVVGMTTLAGCTGESDNSSEDGQQTSKSTSTATQQVTEAVDGTTSILQSSGKKTIEKAAKKTELAVRRKTNIDLSVEVNDELFGQDNLHGIYISTALSESESGEEVGKIVGAYVAVVQTGYPTGDLVVDAHNVDGDKIGTWTAKRKWANQYINGDLNPNELVLMVLNTIKTD